MSIQNNSFNMFDPPVGLLDAHTAWMMIQHGGRHASDTWRPIESGDLDESVTPLLTEDQRTRLRSFIEQGPH